MDAPTASGAYHSVIMWNDLYPHQSLEWLVYWSITLLGAFLMIAAFPVMDLAAPNADPIVFALPALIMVLVGFACVFFGVVTFVLRDDSQLWQ